jgi:hypothetical protein
MDYSRHPEQSAALQILPHYHFAETVLLVGHCSGCRASSRGTCVDQEDGCLPALAGLVGRLAAATARGWLYWAAGLGIRVGGRGLSGRRLLARYPVESTTYRRLDREISGCVDVSNRRGREGECGSSWIKREAGLKSSARGSPPKRGRGPPSKDFPKGDGRVTSIIADLIENSEFEIEASTWWF